MYQPNTPQPQSAQHLHIAPRKTLFDFQRTCLDKVQSLIDAGDRTILLISLMGSGKTTIAAHLIKKYVLEGKRCLFLVDLTVLIRQISSELELWGIPYTVLQSSKNFEKEAPVVVASAQTVDARLRQTRIEELLGSFDLIIYDEAHNLSYRQVARNLYEHYLNRAVILGLTATPWRLNPKEFLGQFYKSTVVTLQPPELIKMGRATPLRVFGFENYFDLDRISTDADGDFNEADMAKQGIETRNLQKVYDEWLKITPDQSTIAFCATVAHAEALSNFFVAQGVTSAFITGDTSEIERQRLFEQLKDGSLKVLASINTLSAGFDCPCVTSILYIRLTRSKALYHQAVGRGARVYSEKDFFYVLDFGASYRKLGNPMDFQNYDITEKKVKDQKRTKLCPNCNAVVSILARICPDCGYEFARPPEEADYQYELDLDLEMVEFFCKEDKRRLYWFRQAKKQAYRNNLHPDSPCHEFKKRYGFFPPRDWHLKAVLGQNPTDADISEFTAYLKKFAPHDFWVKAQLQCELGDTQKQKAKKKQSKTGSKKTTDSDRQKYRSENRIPFKFTSTVPTWEIVLGVPLNATKEQVRQQYRKLSKQWHPDMCRKEEQYLIFDEKMKEINNAYDQFLSIHDR